jgi:hypothetical protein
MNLHLTYRPFLHSFCAVLFFFFITFCTKPDPEPEIYALKANLQKQSWFADLVTQGGIDVTASNNYAFTFKTDTVAIVQRQWLGVTTQFVCSYAINDTTGALNVNYKGTDANWQLAWKLQEMDTTVQFYRFKDERASTATYINLRPF